VSLGQFLAMGGYAAFVWPAYAVTFIVLIGNVIAASRSHRRAMQEARRRSRTAQSAPGG
jgi:heme exporter protein D